MQTEMKCPTCGGDKFKSIDNRSSKCLYCGSTIVHEQQLEVEKTIQDTTNVELNVQQYSSDQDSSGCSMLLVPILIISILAIVLICGGL